MRRFKIYPEYELIVLKHQTEKGISQTYFEDFHNEILSDLDFNNSYNFIIDLRDFGWSEILPEDASNLIEAVNNTRDSSCVAACIISNIGQISYAEIIMNSVDITAHYFSCVADACAFLDVPVNVLDF